MSNPQTTQKCGCGCASNAAGNCGGEKLIFACSGAADVGEVADRAARLLTKRGDGKMYCMAGVGGRVPDILDRTRAAAKIVAIDGCEQDCVRNSLFGAGITPTAHFRLTDLGMEKGKSPATDQNIKIVADKAARCLA